MNHEDRVFTLLIESNPIPHVDDLDVDEIGGARYLETLEQRSSEVTQLDTRAQDNKEEKKKKVMAFVVAAVVVLVAGVGFMVVTQGDEVPVAGQPGSYPTSTAVLSGAEDEAAAGAFQAVNDAYDLFNTGNIEAWVEVRDLGSYWASEELRAIRTPGFTLEEQAKYDAGARYVETECVSHGLGDWPDVADDGLATGYYFTCDAVLTSDFEDSAATRNVESFNWVVNDGAVVAVNGAN